MADGPLPKPGRARRNKDAIPSTVVSFVGAERQALPDDLLRDGEEWHPATVRWWRRWSESSLVEKWTELDWSELEACAVLHNEFMIKRTFSLGSEIRMRMEKFGATPADRARLRIVFADADEKDEKRARQDSSSTRARRGPLKAV